MVLEDKAFGLDRAAYNQEKNAKFDFSVEEEKIGSQIAKGPGAVCTKKGDDYETTTRNEILRLLRKTYGTQAVVEWGTAVLEALQRAEVLRQGVYEGGVYGEAENREELDGDSPPRPTVVAEWLLRDMRKREECGCTSQGRQSAEQRLEQPDESMPELPQQAASSCQDLFDMWAKGEGIWLLRQALSAIQEIRKSPDGEGQSGHCRAIVRRLTPTEAARLQGFPDWWCDGLDELNPTDEEMEFWREVFDTYADVTGASKKTDQAIRKWLEHPHSDSAEYKMWGNGVALPCVEYIMGRIAEFEGQDEYHPVDAQWCRGGRESTMICCGFDAYNQASTGSVSKTLTHKRTDSDHTPVVAVESFARGGSFENEDGV